MATDLDSDTCPECGLDPCDCAAGWDDDPAALPAWATPSGAEVRSEPIAYEDLEKAREQIEHVDAALHAPAAPAVEQAFVREEKAPEPKPLAPALFDVGTYTQRAVSLAERFVIPPFSVLDRRQGYWKKRKGEWLAIGFDSGAGRDALVYKSDSSIGEAMMAISGGQSIFDPVMCEAAYRWWSPAAGHVLDPYAGGSVRGVVAAVTGRHYTGVDIRQEQVDANAATNEKLLAASEYEAMRAPRWVVGDATAEATYAHVAPADLLFTCPPYGDLEVYSDLPGDISNKDWDAFAQAYIHSISLACAKLRDDRFSVWVVGNYRDKRGRLRDMVGLTIQAHEDAGLEYYTDVIMLDPVGTSALRASSTFDAGRKPIRQHQYVLVFCKGDWRKAAAAAEVFRYSETAEAAD